MKGGIVKVKSGVRIFIGKHRVAQILLLLLVAGAVQLAWADDDDSGGSAKFSPEAAATFNKRCTACHTYGKGIKVGPDLKGVNERRKRDWLVKFIQGSSGVIKSGDATAISLFTQFKQQRMPDWADLSAKQINDILDFVAIGGPDIKPADERSAELASPAEIEMGRQLFTGTQRLKYGAQSCGSCHGIRGAGWGGSLGPDLTQTYFKFQDRALTEFLRRPCFQWSAADAGNHYLTAKESFALKAFMRQTALHQSVRVSVGAPPSHPAGTEKASLAAAPLATAQQNAGRKGNAP
ncbi:MAG TPA: c-type cytochrome [Candidatus Angelobacter sp.]|nr:c-type cytochrome [Candidatus Angelobacter sp.]